MSRGALLPRRVSGPAMRFQAGELRVLTIQFRASNEETHEQALEAVKSSQQGGVYSLTDAGEPETEFLIRDSTVQYMGNPPWGVNYHTWLVQQAERIQCELLKV